MANTRDQLIALGRARGYVTYDEINDAMAPPPDEYDAEDEENIREVDEWLAMLDAEGIEVCDADGKRPDVPGT